MTAIRASACKWQSAHWIAAQESISKHHLDWRYITLQSVYNFKGTYLFLPIYTLYWYSSQNSISILKFKSSDTASGGFPYWCKDAGLSYENIYGKHYVTDWSSSSSGLIFHFFSNSTDCSTLSCGQTQTILVNM